MSDVSTDSHEDASDAPRARLVISRFDSSVSLFTSVILLLGPLVLMLLLAWLLRGEVHRRARPPIDRITHGSVPQGAELEFETPGADEVEAITEVAFSVQLEALSNSARRLAADSNAIDPLKRMGPPGDGGRVGESLTPGPRESSGGGPEVRWEIRFQVEDRIDYARQLDHFGIELAAFGGGRNVIESASRLSTRPLRRVNSDPQSERRMYFSWKAGNPLVRYDRQLLARAEISAADRNVVRFIPKALEARLLRLERSHCESAGREFPREVAKTVFETRPQGSGFTFQIQTQRYHTRKTVGAIPPGA